MCSRIRGSVEEAVDIPLDLSRKSIDLQCAMDISPTSLGDSFNISELSSSITAAAVSMSSAVPVDGHSFIHSFIFVH